MPSKPPRPERDCLPDTPCLTPAQLQALVEGALEPAEVESAEQHLDGCPLCRQLIALSTEEPEVVPEPDVVATADASAWRASCGAELASAGTTIGRYRLGEPIGSGATSVVYAARDTKLDREVAVKLLRVMSGVAADDTNAGDAARSRLLREARALARVDHLNVLRVYDASIAGEQVFIAMEKIQGENLSSWLAAGPRPWREILQVLCDAAAGLAAAHAAELVHRDVKPANILMSDDGRVVVSDFGLAAMSGAPPPPDTGATSATTDSNLTRTGAVLGTPAYMAPEVQDGTPATAASDQYSFGVTLYEALAGVRPTHDTDGAALDKAAPRWLCRLVRRTLAEQPEARFPSMAAVRAGLQRPRRARLATGSLAAAAAVTGALIAWSQGTTAPVQCTPEPALWSATWNPERAEALDTTFSSSPRPHAVTTASKIARDLEQRGSHWTETRVEICRATHQRGTQSATLLDQRIACLDDQLDQLDATLELLLNSPTPEVIDRSLQLVAALPSPRECAAARDLAPLNRTAAYAATKKLLSRGWALYHAHDYQHAQELAAQAGQQATTNSDLRLLAESQHLEALARGAHGEFAQAERAATEAAANAARAGDHSRVARAHLALATISGVYQSRFDEGLVWVRATDTELAALASPAPKLQGERHRVAADILVHKADFDGAITELTEALKQTTAAHGPRHILVAEDHTRVAAAYRELGNYQQAAEHAELALSLLRELLGDEHPSLGRPMVYLSTIHRALGAHDRAAQLAEQAINLFEAGYGPKDPDLGVALVALGHARLQQHRYADARVIYRRTLKLATELGGDSATRSRAIGYLANVDLVEGAFTAAADHYRAALALATEAADDSHPRVAGLRLNLGLALEGAGQLDAAELEVARARDSWIASLGANHLRSATAHFALGQVRRQRGDCASALSLFQQAAEVNKANGIADTREAALALGGMGICHEQLGHHSEAIRYLEQAVALQPDAADTPEKLAQLRYHLAVALARAGQRDRARQLAETAVAGFERSTAGYQIEELGRPMRPDEAAKYLRRARSWRDSLR